MSEREVGRMEKRGGYSGGKPASSMGLPQRMPSGAVKAAQTPASARPKRKAN